MRNYSSAIFSLAGQEVGKFKTYSYLDNSETDLRELSISAYIGDWHYCQCVIFLGECVRPIDRFDGYIVVYVVYSQLQMILTGAH